ncbi:MAG: tetratricopeptide repeat protein [Alphaproteobacteria bacterium]|nr:tetratricopeptide repeat protein [Alphaproteobacteria bacterium]
MSEFDRAVADHRAGRIEAAADIYRGILDENPAHADAWHLLGLTLHQRGHNTSAVPAIHRALLLDPRVANYHNSLGLVLHRLVDYDGAVKALQTATALDGDDADAHNNLGMVYTDMRRFTDAENALRKSLGIRPENPGAVYNLGRVLVWQGDAEEAVGLLHKACAMDPRNPTYRNTLGVALAQIHEFGAAREAFETAISIDPAQVDAHVNLAHSLLLDSEYDRGWETHEWRLRRPEFARRMSVEPWRGEDISGQTILLWAEQGLGDAIQFIRYASLVADRGARVIVECPAALHDLFRTVRGVADVIAPGVAVPHDAHAALLSLPLLFGVRSSSDPYIPKPSPVLPESGGRLRVGLVWAGNPMHANDRNRSQSLASFAPLVSAKCIFHGLQAGAAASDSEPEGMLLLRLGDGFHSFADTAAALSALDLLISVDTSVAHLAGALAIPTWLILPSSPDWRWGRDGETTPWYPSMRLFRQLAAEPKQKVFERLAKSLAAL